MTHRTDAAAKLASSLRTAARRHRVARKVRDWTITGDRDTATLDTGKAQITVTALADGALTVHYLSPFLEMRGSAASLSAYMDRAAENVALR
ncbi:MAG: hypothetical protein Q4G40_12040 [Brachybacterium sp.]|nr:hypothetical protein [Brachybacterium sp.]